MEPQDKIFEIDINMLQANPLQPRGLITPESLAELAESIREHGILEPLVLAKTPAGYQIIAGERRWRASRLVGYSVSFSKTGNCHESPRISLAFVPLRK